LSSSATGGLKAGQAVATVNCSSYAAATKSQLPVAIGASALTTAPEGTVTQ